MTATSPTDTASTLLAIAGTAPITGTNSSAHIIIARWRAHVVSWLCCMPIQYTYGQH
ncbi:hypothetical protein BDR04DRAFT_1107705 [Suillus decipiens]|nr:hypothetical protein BDR04DRAFT_1107705 [Suillus decipiens]